MNEKDKRKLSEAEQRRLERYERLSEDLIQQGYTRTELIVDIKKANVFAVVLLIPLFIVGYGLYALINHTIAFPDSLLITIIVVLVLVVVHELIHGLCWSLFTPNHFKDIEFGIMMPLVTPYCTCLVPLTKGQHIFGTVMPLVILGLIPMIAGAFLANPYLMFIGIIMADAAAGDILIIFRLLGYKSKAREIVYMDHPTEAGGVIFEK